MDSPSRSVLWRCISLLLWASLVAACSDQRLESRLDAVTPLVFPRSDPTELTLSGYFIPEIDVSLTLGEVRNNADFSAWIVLKAAESSDDEVGQRFALESVQFVDENEITVVTPRNIPAGVYGIELEDPRGVPVTLSQVIELTVKEDPPDHVSLTADTDHLVADDEDALRLDLRTLTRRGDVYPWAGGHVTVWIDGGNAYFYKHTLGNASEPVAGETREIQGTLDDEGTGSVYVRTAIVDNFWVRVESEDLPHGTSDGAFHVVVEPADLAGFDVRFRGADPTNDGMRTLTAGEGAEVKITAVSENNAVIPSYDDTLSVFDTTGEPVDTGGQAVSMVNGLWNGQVFFTRATGEDYYLQLVAVSETGKVGMSEPFIVVPAQPEALVVNAELGTGGDQIGVGEFFSISVSSEDDYGNVIALAEDDLPELTDDTGTLECASVQHIAGLIRYEDCVITQARSENVIHGELDGLEGDSQTFEVMPSEAVALVLSPISDVIAGVPFSLSVFVEDEYGNRVTDVGGTVDVVDQPEDGEAELSNVTVELVDGYGERDDLVLTRAVDKTVLIASLSARDLSGKSNEFAVQPGPAKSFGFRIPSEVTAGEAALGRITAFDANDNVVVDFTSDKIILTDSTTSLSDYSFGAFENGEADFSFTPVTAGSDIMLMAQDVYSSAQGTSESFVVLPGAVDSLLVSGIRDVLWDDRPFDLEVTAMDAYGNVATGFEGEATVNDEHSSLAFADGTEGPLNIGPFIQGRWRGSVMLTAVEDENKIRVRVNDQGKDAATGLSSTFSVYDLDCAEPPSISLSMDGSTDNEYVSLCLPVRPGGDAQASFSVEQETSSPIYRYIWSFGDATWESGDDLSAVAHSYSTPGRYEVEVAVIDEHRCGAVDSGIVYVGLGDGSPTGPMTLSPDNDEVISGETDGTQRVGFSVEALDCSGDAIQIRYSMTVLSTLGTLQVPGGDSDNNAPGVQFLYDPRDEGSAFHVDFSDVRQGNRARVFVSYGADQAVGWSEIRVTNDTRPPYVVDVSPDGYYDGLLEDIQILFSEPMRNPDGLLESLDIRVESATSGPLTFTRTLDDSQRLLTLSLDTPLSLGDVPDDITLTLPSSRGAPSFADDPEGNRLDGDWDGDAEDEGDDFSTSIGNLTIMPPEGGLSACYFSPQVFSPDGQDGTSVGEEDSVTLYVDGGLSRHVVALGVEARPAFKAETVSWMWQNAALLPKSLFRRMFPLREPVREWPLPIDNGGLIEVFTWAGRDQDEVILPNDEYELYLWSVDDQGNRVATLCFGLDEGHSILELSNPLDLVGAVP